jgi:hypothetical protein
LVLLLLAWQASVRADEQPATRPPPALFPKGTWDLEACGGYASEFYPYDHIKLATGSIGVGFFPKDNFAISLQVPGYAVQQIGPSAQMFGLNLSLRDHFFQRDRFSFFGDLIGGLAQSNRQVPAGGTYFNFTLQSGVGATFQLTNNLHLVGGVHFFHLSNAAIRGINHNPDLNALEGYAGLIFTF